MSKRSLWILLGTGVITAVLGLGAVAGGALAYFALQAPSVRAGIPLAGELLQGDRLLQASDTGEGLLIASVEEDSPAASAGVVRGDILLKINDQAVNNYADLAKALQALKPDDNATLTLKHGDEQRTLDATLGNRQGSAYLGVMICSCMGGDNHVFVLKDGSGAVITEVVAESPAAEADLQVGDRILAVDGQEVNQENPLGNLIAGHRVGDEVTLKVERTASEDSEPEEVEVKVTLGENPDQAGKAYLGVKYTSSPDILHGHGFFGGEIPAIPGLPPETFELPELPEGVNSGVLVGEVVKDSPAETAGLKSGDLLLSVDGTEIENPKELAELVSKHKPGDQINLEVLALPSDNDKAKTVKVTLGENPDKAGEAYLGIQALVFFNRKVDGYGNEEDNSLFPSLKDFPFQFPKQTPEAQPDSGGTL